jgi:hypothetical protein
MSAPPFAFEPRGKRAPRAGSRRLRFWSVRRARLMETLYNLFERGLVSVAPLAQRIGFARAERPVAAIEARIKGALFDCRMCGECILSSTGMSCPMNCPKALRNGPCGGVRANGNCEVDADMPCVWVKAWEGSERMREGDAISLIQPPLDHRLKGSSSWLRIARRRLGVEEAA